MRTSQAPGGARAGGFLMATTNESHDAFLAAFASYNRIILLNSLSKNREHTQAQGMHPLGFSLGKSGAGWVGIGELPKRDDGRNLFIIHGLVRA